MSIYRTYTYVDAMQFDGENGYAIQDNFSPKVSYCFGGALKFLQVFNEGEVYEANVGDWVVQDADGIMVLEDAVFTDLRYELAEIPSDPDGYVPPSMPVLEDDEIDLVPAPVEEPAQQPDPEVPYVSIPEPVPEVEPGPDSSPVADPADAPAPEVDTGPEPTPILDYVADGATAPEVVTPSSGSVWEDLGIPDPTVTQEVTDELPPPETVPAEEPVAGPELVEEANGEPEAPAIEVPADDVPAGYPAGVVDEAPAVEVPADVSAPGVVEEPAPEPAPVDPEQTDIEDLLKTL